ncbi:MAG: hypothetical protein FLDDKLPJ_00075 [Phycisphaerae bacterium]|nr:hypothetical protein [Phycisphaerae bacterium]
MMRWVIPSCVRVFVAAVLAGCALPATAQQTWGRFGGWRGEGEDQLTEEERREQMRKRLEEMRKATPEQRREMELDRMLDFTARAYELTDEQRPVVRAEMKKMADEYRAQAGPDADEMDRLRDQMSEFWLKRMSEPREEGEGPQVPWNDPEFRRIGERMRELNEKHPFDFRASLERVEKLLPPEQVDQARQRREQFGQGMMERARERMEEMAQQVAREPENKELFERFSQMRERMAEWNRRRQEGQGGGDAGRGGDVPRPEASPAVQTHPWDAYLAEFTRRHALDEGQRASAASILSDVRAREAKLRASQASARASAEAMTDAEARAKAIAELDAPIDALFAEFKTRLSALLTAAQKQTGGR